MYMPTSRWSWLFAIISVVQAAIVLALESFVFAKFQIDLRGDEKNQLAQEPQRTIPTFLTLYIFGFVYQLLLVWDGLRLKNTIQIIGLCMYNVGLLIYGAVQYQQLQEAVLELVGIGAVNINLWTECRPFLIAVPCVLALGTVLLGLVTRKLYEEFAWTIYKHISAEVRMKRRYLVFQIYITPLKFGFFFFVGFTVQFVVIVTEKTNVEFGLTLAAIPVTIVILLAAAFFCRREILSGTIVVIFLYFGALAYFLFKLVRMYSKSHERFYIAARKELTTFAVITIILILAIIVNACMCASNYGKGLEPYVTRRKVDDTEAKAGYTMELVTGPNGKVGPVATRMTID